MIQPDDTKNDTSITNEAIIGRLITAIEAIQRFPNEAKAGWVCEILIEAKVYHGDYAFRESMRP